MAGCTYPGDYIGDTPYQAGPTLACTVQNTCPGLPGDDPVQNMVRTSRHPENAVWVIVQGQGQV